MRFFKKYGHLALIGAIILVAVIIYQSSLNSLKSAMYLDAVAIRLKILAVWPIAGALTLFVLLHGIYFWRTGRELFSDYSDKNNNKSDKSMLTFALIGGAGSRDDKDFNAYNSNLPTSRTRSYTPSGIIFGRDNEGNLRYSPKSSEGSCAVIGGAGSGKTSGLIIPTLRAWGSGALVVDIAGDISSAVVDPGRITIDMSRPDGGYSWDAFAEYKRAQSKAEELEAVEKIALALIPEISTSDAGQYYEYNGRILLNAWLLLAARCGRTFSEACKSFLSLSAQDIINYITQKNEEDAVILVKRFDGGQEKNLSESKISADKVVSQLATSPVLQRIFDTSGETISPADLDRHSVYIRVPEEKFDNYSVAMRLITSQVLDWAKTRPTTAKQLLICLDELPRIGVDISQPLAMLRKHRVRIMFACQSLAQLRERYGADGSAVIMDNSAYMAVLSAYDPDTQDYISRRIGEYDRSMVSYSTGGASGSSQTLSTQRTRRLDPASLSYLGDNLILISPDGWARLRKNYYYK